MIVCVRGTCQREAEVLPVLVIPPKREPSHSKAGVRVQFGLPCCRRCSFDVGVRELVNQAGARGITRDFLKFYKKPPDFPRAQIDWIPLTSKEAREFIGTIPAPVKGTIH